MMRNKQWLINTLEKVYENLQKSRFVDSKMWLKLMDTLEEILHEIKPGGFES